MAKPTWRERLGGFIAGRSAALGGSGISDRPIDDLGGPSPSFPQPSLETESRIKNRDALFGSVAANAGPNRTRISTYPATNLNVGIIRDVHAEADLGIVYRYGDFAYQLLWRDGHIYASHRERASAVAGNEFRIHSANESDLARSLRDYMEAVVDGIDRFDASCYSLLDAPMVGWSCVEQVYETGRVRFLGPSGKSITLRGAFPRRLEWVHPKHFWFDFNRDYPLLDLGNDGKVRLEQHKFIYHETSGNGIVATRGWMRPVSWLSFFKSNGIRDLSVFLHLFGIPNIWAQIDREKWQDPEFRAVLEQALRDFGQGNPSVLFKDMTVAIQPSQSAAGNGQVHLPYIGFMNAEISKVIKGETLTSEAGMSGNSYALSQTHQDTFFGTVTMDNRGLSNTFRSQAFRSWIEVNAEPLQNAFGVPLDELLANRPFCTHAIEQGISPMQKATIFDVAVNKLGLVIGNSEAYRRLGINPPKPGEETLKGEPTPLPADAKTVGSVEAAEGEDNPKPAAPSAPAPAPADHSMMAMASMMAGDFDEQKHPRAPNGEFGEGSGGGGGGGGDDDDDEPPVEKHKADYHTPTTKPTERKTAPATPTKKNPEPKEGETKQVPGASPGSQLSQHVQDRLAALGVKKLPAAHISEVEVSNDLHADSDIVHQHALIKWKDDKGRAQSAYTPEFDRRNAEEKWARVLGNRPKLEAAIPALREQAADSPTHAAALLISQTGLRPGSAASVKAEGHYGATTMEARHVSFDKAGAHIEYVGKEGVTNHAHVSDPPEGALIAALKGAVEGKAPGDRVFPGMTGAKVAGVLPEGVMVKDLRTTIATTQAEKHFAKITPTLTGDEREDALHILALIKGVSEQVSTTLNNTHAMARKSYIAPQVIKSWGEKHGVNAAWLELGAKAPGKK